MISEPLSTLQKARPDPLSHGQSMDRPARRVNGSFAGQTFHPECLSSFDTPPFPPDRDGALGGEMGNLAAHQGINTGSPGGIPTSEARMCDGLSRAKAGQVELE